ncbi:MAG: Asp-tRNA(Asn)/Glu-tRNA(Gln) amidotransferase subunit GatB [Candidatus Zixiibacteriota bacterium]|nr:MAG: Asp-tRNA(Asn)/Glu-tRNA(Gln) amidotransferase subunit GatB [candidate division Zixibacteria bacterium]
MTGANGYETVIGLEVHAQLKTETKIFCGCRSAYGAEPNSLTCPTCLGLPGALPVLNQQAVVCAARAVLALDGTVNPESRFARKSYFYPDLPKGYQITQYEHPLAVGGEVRYPGRNGTRKSCRLTRIHLEEDAGKSIHPERGQLHTRLDFNRCGVPLIEIVSESDIRSPEDAYGYLLTLKQILQYADVCAGDMEKGQLRVDANVSVRVAGADATATRTEIKNLNSFKAVRRAIAFEVRRQIGVTESGGKVDRATLFWDESAQAAKIMRTKEQSPDYRYLAEPDLAPLVLSEEWIEEIRRQLPELPEVRAGRFVKQYGIGDHDAAVLTQSRGLADYFEAVVRDFPDGRTASNWIQTRLLGYLNDSRVEIENCPVTPDQMAGLLSAVRTGRISAATAVDVFRQMLTTGNDFQSIIEEQGLVLIEDESVIGRIIDEVLAGNPENVAAFKAGKSALLTFFVGQVMRNSGGQADPQVVRRILIEKLEAG